MRALRRLLPALAVIGCATTPAPAPAPAPPPPSVAPIAPRGVQARPIGPKPGRPSRRYTLDLHARAQLAGRRATVEWTLEVAALNGDRSVDLYLEAPPGVAVDALWLDVKEGVLSKGRVAPAWSAAEVYERVTAQRIDPALLERVDDTRFRLRVFPLDRPRVVRLRYHAILPATAEGMLLQVPRPHLAVEPDAWPNTVRLEVEDAAGTAHLTDRLALALPFEARRAESAADGAYRVSQWQLVPTRLSVAEAQTMVAAIDAGAESPPTAPLFEFVDCVRGTLTVAPCGRSAGAVTGATGWAPKGATDLVALLTAAAPVARAKRASIGVITGGHDRWRDLDEVLAALPEGIAVHPQATPGANLGVLSRLAEQGGGHLLLGSRRILGETKITDLRIEMLQGDAEWLDLPRSHVLGTPIVLTARHTGAVRARLHGRVGPHTFVADLPATEGEAAQGIVPLWYRARLQKTPNAEVAIGAHLVTRATSLAVFERARDYTAAQSGNPDLAGPPMSPQRPRVVVHDQRVEVRERIYFKSGSAQVPAQAMAILKEIAQVARQNLSLRFAVIGHTDARERRPDALSLRRAAAVHRVLLGLGVPTTQMSLLGRAGNFPLDQNTSADGRAHNRRVEFQVLAYRGSTYGPDLAQSSTRLRDVDRIQFIEALLSHRAVEPARTRVKSNHARLRALRRQLTDVERMAYFNWVFRPDEIDAEVDRLDIDALPEASQASLIQVLAGRKDWARLLPRSRGRLRVLSAAQLVDFMANAPAPIEAICAPDLALCAQHLHTLAQANAERARQLAGLALRGLPKPPQAALTYARPDDPAIPGALTGQIARPTATAADFRRVYQWATKLKRPRIACLALARSTVLGERRTAPPGGRTCPDAF